MIGWVVATVYAAALLSMFVRGRSVRVKGDEGRRNALRAFLGALDGPHRAYAEGVAEELSLGEPAPPADGLRPELVRDIRRRLTEEWRARIATMPGSRAAR